MKKILLIFVLLCTAPSFATTWYVRTDGGTATQCTGTTNAPYPGSGTAQSCAVNHPFWLLNQPAWTWRIAANDTIQFEDLGPYYMGQGRNGYGLTWSHCSGGENDCDLPSLPNGVRFLGMNAGNCHKSDHSGLLNPTVLLGINHVFRVLDAEGTQSPDIECLDISSMNTCTVENVQQNPITNTALTSGVATYTWTYSGSGYKPVAGMPVTVTGTTNGGGIFNIAGLFVSSVTLNTGGNSGTFTVNIAGADVPSAADTGTQSYYGHCVSATNDGSNNGIILSYTKSKGPSNLTLKDVAIHGMRSTAILGAYLNSSLTDVTRISDIYIAGNGGAGWDSDGGGCGNSCESTGTINVSYVSSLWNGCAEVLPNGGTIGGNGYNYCVDQGYGGNGDGLVMIAENGTWNWSHIVTNYNAQDGFDALHIGDDTSISPIINMDYIYAEGNEGQSIKGGGGQMTLTNSIGIANCNVFANASNFPLNPQGWNVFVGLPCRANDAMAFALHPSDTLNIRYVTNVVGQNVSWDFSNGSCSGNCTLNFHDNATLGFVGTAHGTYPGAVVNSGPWPFTDGASSVSNNAWYHMGNSGTTCPAGAGETNYVCGDPLFTAESDINSMNVAPTASSPLRGAGIAISGITTDYNGNLRPNLPSIGALELGTDPPPALLFSGSIMFSGNGRF